ncbi:hypothetical protein KIK06_11090 [Nocardiopsis sp. EMB25]|uniref:hypothetical protein n=1 Tax=Nocardiopsis TaxID=2013 RepID=UPI00034B7C72|nr:MULTISPECIES: hypothetical protein [Nocardiopsis]MCY9784437.1 hypothetical protein [Nocardiopsis sp. EMB25]
MSRASRPEHSRPTVVIVIAPDERSAEISIEGHRQIVTGQAPRETRRAALDVATGYAAGIGRPVLVDARDANGFWRLVATPDGVVQAADTVEPGRPQAPRPEEGRRGRRGRVPLIAGAAVLALALIVGAGALTLRFLPEAPATPASGGTEEAAEPLPWPAPPGFAGTVVFDAEVAPGTEPRVSRDGELLSVIAPGDQLHLYDAEGERLWAADLPVETGESLGIPHIVRYDGAPAVVLETADALLFWSEEGGAPDRVDLPDDAVAQYAGESVLVRTDEDDFVPVGGELREVEVPGGAASMLAEGDRVLTAVVDGPWVWVDPDGGSTEVHAQRPEGAGEMDRVLTALREYVIVLWRSAEGDGSHMAFHDGQNGAVVAAIEVDASDLEGAGYASWPIGTRTASYGPTVVDLESGDGSVVPGFAAEIAVGDQVFGELDGRSVAVRADGTVSDLPEGAERPQGLLGDNAVVLHDDHLYAIPPQ